MGIWNKTLFYLGLVDEDADPGHNDPRSAPRSRRDVETEYPGAPRRSDAPPVRPSQSSRPIGSRRPSDQYGEGAPDLFSTGERPAVSREPEAPRGVQGRRVEPPMVGRRRTIADQALSDSGVTISPVERPLVRTFSDNDLESEVIVARSYSDAQTVADHLRASVPVVLDLRKVEPAMVRRLVDFSSGLTYALGGSMRKIGQGVVLVTPPNVNISRDERRRLRDLGYHEAPEES